MSQLTADFLRCTFSTDCLKQENIYFGLPTEEDPETMFGIPSPSSLSANFRLIIRSDNTHFYSNHHNPLKHYDIPKCYFVLNDKELLNPKTKSTGKLDGRIAFGFSSDNIPVIMGGRIFKNKQWLSYPCVLNMAMNRIECDGRNYDFSNCFFCVPETKLTTFSYILKTIPFHNFDWFVPQNESIAILKKQNIDLSLIEKAQQLFEEDTNDVINITVSGKPFSINGFLKPLFGKDCPFVHSDILINQTASEADYPVDPDVFKVILLCIKRIFQDKQLPYELLEKNIAMVDDIIKIVDCFNIEVLLPLLVLKN